MVEGIASISRSSNHWRGRRATTAEGDDVFTIEVVHSIQEYGTSHYVDRDMGSLFQNIASSVPAAGYLFSKRLLASYTSTCIENSYSLLSMSD
jgi:hypothetical protein